LIVFFLTFSASILTIYTANAWGFDMFSFFTKDKVAPTVVHASLDAKLTKLSSYPENLNLPEPQNQNCLKAKLQGAAPLALTIEEGYIEPSQSAFVWNSVSPIALINNQANARFDVWELESIDSLKPVKKVPTNELSSRSKNWIHYSVVDVACLPEQQLLVAVNYYDPRSKIALYLYDIANQSFSIYSEADTNAQNLDKYFEQKNLNSGESVIVYYSETKRKSAEIYHNYYNNIVLFSDKYPQGIEILKLGIDDGNVEKWQVTDKKLLLHTIDNRDHKDPKSYFWSLDLSKVLSN
jgi:hypothetical protein